ncbi:hypothetical protein EV122DRAFT_260569 [Schizophyllum commune]
MESTPTKPMIRQQRALVACTNCRQRKIKCEPSNTQSGAACKRCQKHGYTCEYKAVAEDHGQDDYQRRSHHSYSPEERTSPHSHLSSMSSYSSYGSAPFLSVPPYTQQSSTAPYPSQHYAMTRTGSDHSVGPQSAYDDFAGAYTNETPYSPCFPLGLSGGATTAFEDLRSTGRRTSSLSTSHESYFLARDNRVPWGDRPMHHTHHGEEFPPATSPMDYFSTVSSYPTLPGPRSTPAAAHLSGYPCHCPTCMASSIDASAAADIGRGPDVLENREVTGAHSRSSRSASQLAYF